MAMIRFNAAFLLTALLAVHFWNCASQSVSRKNYYVNKDVKQTGDRICDLSNKFLKHVPDPLPHACTFLDLSLNRISNVSGYAFSSLGSTLLSLDLSGNGMTSLNDHAFSNLSKLICLDLSNNGHLGLDTAFKALYGLQNRTMKTLNFHVLNHVVSHIADLAVTNDMFKYFKEMCVRHLDISHNFISYMEPGVFKSLKHPLCLQRLNAGEQTISTASLNSIYKEWNTLDNLTELDMTGYVPAKHRTRHKRMAISTGESPGHKGWVISTGESPARFDQTGTGYAVSAHINVTIPKSLERLYASHAIGHNSFTHKLRVINGHNLIELDVSYGGLVGCNYSIEGLTNLRVLNASGLDLTYLNPVTCLNYPTLEVIVVQQANLDRAFSQELAHYTFANEVNLRYVDLSDNSLYDLPEHLFRFNRHLHTIILYSNKLRKIPEAILRVAKLQQLDVSYNVIVSLSTRERRFLDGRASENNGSFILNLNRNPLTCTCSSFDSVEWLLTTHVHIQDLCDLQCILENSTQISVCILRTQLRSMQISCTSKLWLNIGMASCILVILILTTIAIVYRNRRRIQYYLYSRCAMVPPYPRTVGQYEFDVFVSYCSGDEQWVRNELVHFLTIKDFQICLHHKDFVPGDPISENIVRSVNNCRKTLLVISRKFANAPWCQFEIEMVNMRSLDEGRDDVAVPILLEDVPMAQMPVTLQKFWRNVGFLVWDNNPVKKQEFWERLERVLRD